MCTKWFPVYFKLENEYSEEIFIMSMSVFIVSVEITVKMSSELQIFYKNIKLSDSA